jgi:hypothetical protein
MDQNWIGLGMMAAEITKQIQAKRAARGNPPVPHFNSREYFILTGGIALSYVSAALFAQFGWSQHWPDATNTVVCALPLSAILWAGIARRRRLSTFGLPA